jgi:hypothetical protein
MKNVNKTATGTFIDAFNTALKCDKIKSAVTFVPILKMEAPSYGLK